MMEELETRFDVNIIGIEERISELRSDGSKGDGRGSKLSNLGLQSLILGTQGIHVHAGGSTHVLAQVFHCVGWPLWLLVKPHQDCEVGLAG